MLAIDKKIIEKDSPITSKNQDSSVEFDDLRNAYPKYEEEIFEVYVEDIFKTLCSKDSGSNQKYLSKTTFTTFIPNLQLFISEKLYYSFCSVKDNKLYFEDFLRPLQIFRYGSYEDNEKLIFNLFDFDRDGTINSKDITLLLSYLPLKEETKKKAYKYQMESIKELNELAKITFDTNLNLINFLDFKKAMEKKPDIFLHIFCFLYVNIPIFDKSLKFYIKVAKERRSSKGSIAESDTTSSIVSAKSQKSVYSSPDGKKFQLNSPTCFSPIANLHSLSQANSFSPKQPRKNSLPTTVKNFKLRFDETNQPKESLEEVGNRKLSDNDKATKTLLEMKCKKNGGSPQKSNLFSNDSPKKEKITNSNNFLKEDVLGQYDDLKPFDNSPIDDKLFELQEEEKQYHNQILEQEENEEDDQTLDQDCQKMIKYEGDLIYFSKGSNDGIKQNKNFISLSSNNSMYFYNSEKDQREAYSKFKYLGGCFIKENKPEKIDSVEFFSFTIKFPNNKKKQYYNQDKIAIKNWIKNLRETTKYKNFFDYYQLDKTLGTGQFGLVKLGKNLRNGKLVAVKILEKENIKTKDDWDLIKTEIDILKHSKHPNIVKFFDHFENSDYIFLVMEYLNNGNLQEYLMKNNFNLNEIEVGVIAYQMADALKYLHTYGVIHRDFKPENIMLRQSSKDEQIEIKLMDFGLSKILGVKEKTLEGYGTMAFVAPEVIAKEPYSFSVDIWSLGITIYYMLSSEIPFLAKDKKENTADLILTKDLQFSQKFKKNSPDVIDLIRSCLNKNPKQRITIEKVLNHDWFQKNLFPKGK